MSELVRQSRPIAWLDRTSGHRLSVLGKTGPRTTIMALGICAVTLAGCSSSQITTAAAPTPVSSTVYQDKLRSANIAVAAAMDRFAAARSPEQVRAGLEQAWGAVGEAAQLLEITPPVEVQAVHRDLLAGLRQLAVDLSHLRDQAMSKTLCAGPSVMAAVSKGPGMTHLLSVREILGSGREGVSYQWEDLLPAPMQLPQRRLVNGQLIDSMHRGGRGQLRVDNGTGHDAVVELVQDGKPVVSVYVGTGLNTTVDDIDDGSYELFYTSGIDWDSQLKTFTRSCLFKRFPMPASVTTTPMEGAVRSTTQVIGLRDKIEENAQTTVPSQSFPR
jgi:hypothetical protein